MNYRLKRDVIVANVNGLISTRDDGRNISRSMISREVKRAWKETDVKPFVFHSYSSGSVRNRTRA